MSKYIKHGKVGKPTKLTPQFIKLLKRDAENPVEYCNNKKGVRDSTIKSFVNYLDRVLKIVKDGQDGIHIKVEIERFSIFDRWYLNYIRRTPAYREWREAVYRRDNHKCIDCGSGKDFQAHHLIPVSKRPDLVFTLSNGVTLCRDCHTKLHPELEGLLKHSFVKND